MTAAELKRVAFKATADRMITLGELCELVAGRATLVIELKSRFDGDRRLVARAAEVLAGYRGPAAVMSFDPAQIAALRAIAPQLPRGLVAESRSLGRRRGSRSPRAKRRVASVAHAPARAPAIHRLFGQRPAGGAADGRAQDFAAAAADLDRAQRRRRARPRAMPTR